MSDRIPGGASVPRALPDSPNLEWLRKQAKRRLESIRADDPAATLAQAQFAIAREYGFTSWRALKAHLDGLGVDGQLIAAARAGDVDVLTRLLDAHPQRVQLRDRPYEWTLLHHAAFAGRLSAVALLVARGLDVNGRERGDNTYPIHWAAVAGHRPVVTWLADHGADIVGYGDDHLYEVIGWATCFDACHCDVAALLVQRGARHHIFSALACELADEVRAIVAANPDALQQRSSRNEEFRLPLHFAVLKNLPDMVELLLDLGADPRGVDGSGFPVVVYATAPDVDAAILHLLVKRGGTHDLLTALAAGDWTAAERFRTEIGHEAGVAGNGALHLMARRGNLAAVNWLLERGADPNGRWNHWDASVTALHMAAAFGHVDVVRRLLAAGADPRIHDSKHDGDALGWAQHFRREEVLAVLRQALHIDE